MKRIDTDYMHTVLRCEYFTGKIYWRERPLEHFKTEQAYKSWNARFPDTEAGTVGPEGYRVIKVNGTKYKAHRLSYFMCNKDADNSLFIDHISGDKLDNRIKNLRLVTHQENQKNAKRPKNNTSGVTGVKRNKNSGKWRAEIKVKGKQKHLGYFTDKAEAIAARQQAETNHGYHENHGRS